MVGAVFIYGHVLCSFCSVLLSPSGRKMCGSAYCRPPQSVSCSYCPSPWPGSIGVCQVSRLCCIAGQSTDPGEAWRWQSFSRGQISRFRGRVH
ncbi:uncharacterized protein CLUP02_02205 [Colletotrichum lupini]|uniref:Secreted protein n=1 Tax=Colletotrichum lupini TaxID=145971 RepID=A0A9Q8SEN7_9PEZI|nr:uncharacterized protein CLUP02_02205 [Colletotrichum lupini]KAK1708036.1 hypothetical protein BDP67DRAFT_525827 [Colletotrichum lupini]UQC75551.1 hypothetical protein CLUP02_02205 [Colletotrichum lupini]